MDSQEQAAAEAYNLTRMRQVIARLASELPGANVSEITVGAMGFTSVTVSFANGYSVLLSVDADLPEALYELVRFVAPHDVHRFPFEARTTLGAAYSDKLSGDALLRTLAEYMRLENPRQAPRQGDEVC